ncbi:MAG: GAF domain-containing protein, partial [Nonlabens sp.]|nr:GAF domain-containing protein [Nonlabens sp.]
MQEIDFMMDVTLSFNELLNDYRLRLETETNPLVINYLNGILAYAKANPALEDGFKIEELELYKEQIKVISADLFPAALTKNEIKGLTIPFSNLLFNCSERLKNVLEHAPEDFSILQDSDFDNFTMSCGVILNAVYGVSLDLSRALHCDIPDATGRMHTYRITYNADFINVHRNEGVKALEREEVLELLQNPEDTALWKKRFPPHSYSFKGFGIVSLTDVTTERSVSDLKTVLLNGNTDTKEPNSEVENIFKRLFNIDDLRVGLTIFENREKQFSHVSFETAPSFILGNIPEQDCKTALCSDAYKKLLVDFKTLVIPDVAVYAKNIDNRYLTDTFQEQGIKSAILHPLSNRGKLLGIMEIVSTQAYALNMFNSLKIKEISEYVTVSLIRSNDEYANRIKALIQSECTSIHPSVKWRFDSEAHRVLTKREQNKKASFKDIVFEDVHPLYGQIDVVGSSDARNDAIKQDLVSQLTRVCDIFAFAKATQPIPIYDQITHRILVILDDLERDGMDANTERVITKLLVDEVNPTMQHVSRLSDRLKEMVTTYVTETSATDGVIHEHRSNYDTAIQVVNDEVAMHLDYAQKEAQQLFPHYFERFKTDGVEHNIYVGSSISNTIEYSSIYLSNLRLWQLQTMISMEHHFYAVQKDLPVRVHAASMILVFGNTLSIRYRIDEKRFDVDGSYNARYEVIKKRIDKAHIKNTEERITQKGFISIIYTNEESEHEYLRYIKYLQDEKQLERNEEILELEEVQGVSGLKAIRVGVLYKSIEK